jgi:transcriptional regulator with XRE-family HTH domain
MSDLRKIRKDRGLTIEAVAYLAGVDAATVSRIENGIVQPRSETVVTIAKALGVSVSRIAPDDRESVG